MRRYSYLSILHAFGLLALFIVICILFSPIVWLLKDQISGEKLQVLYYVLTGAPAVVLFARTKKNIYKTREISQKLFSFKPVGVKIFFCTIISGVGILFGLVFPITDLIPIPDFMNNLDIDAGWLSFLLMVVIAPVVEEILYRSVVLDCLLFHYSPVVSIIISSVIFGLAHLNPWQFIAAFILGLLSGYLYYKYKNLTINVVLHASVNLVGYLIMLFFSEYSRYTDIYEHYSTTSIVILISLLLFFAGIFTIIKDDNEAKNPQSAVN
ncbi:MAG: CPBP family intramembrane metalloprotease [Bacteroidales bacterium]|nr:CPBP family intramembrane metalloprotease [Bacteroidales bacterium]MBR4917941.1 CPBP family intramembrane metalloprotease [Bacteroidales bacterium]